EADLARHINHSHRDSFPLQKKELNKICLEYFNKYCKEQKTLNNQVYRLFHDCKETEWIPKGNSTYTSQETIPLEAKNILQDFMEKDLDGFLVSWVQAEGFKEKSYSVSTFPRDLFGDWAGFENYLEKQDVDKWKNLSEFKKFFSVFKAKDFMVYVPFEFQTIPR
ncbi:MAG: hypothetical protein AB1458_12110, partial [Bacteroidota bacterium]